MFELRTKLVTYTILVVLAVAGGLSTISITLDHRNAVAAFERKVTALAQTLGEAVVESIFVLDVKPLRQQVASVMTNKEARAAFILDSNGRVLTDGTEENTSHTSALSSEFAQRILSEKIWITEHHSTGIVAGGPIMLTQDYVLGYVYLDFSTANLQSRVMGQIQQSLIISALFVVVTALLAIAVAKQLIRPINKLTGFASRITEGSPERDLPDCGGGEVGRLAQSFSAMLANLDRSNTELKQLAETLEEKVQDRTQAAEAGSKAKSEFLATMSHEIRTPMNGVLGMASLLKETKLDTEQELFVNTISESAEALLVIINDILDFSKIEAGKITLQEDWFDLENLIDSILKLLSQKAADKDLDLILDYDPDMPKVFMGDEGRLRQLLMNLLGNAEKFTLEGSIRVVVSGQVTAGFAALKIAVQDTGIGIPEEKQADVFEEFSQVNASKNRSFGGTGLGLSIAEDLALLMGGKIELHSVVNQGSTFTFSCEFKTNSAVPKLSLADSSAPDVSANSAAEPNINEPQQALSLPHSPVPDLLQSPLKVLVADDNDTNRLVVQKMLQETGCEIHFATDGLEAIEQYLAHRPQLVLMDISMPNLTGLEATQELRSHEAQNYWPACPIHALTAHAMKGDRERFIEQGFTGYLSKPVRKQHLLELVLALQVSQKSAPLQAPKTQAGQTS